MLKLRSPKLNQLNFPEELLETGWALWNFGRMSLELLLGCPKNVSGIFLSSSNRKCQGRDKTMKAISYQFIGWQFSFYILQFTVYSFFAQMDSTNKWPPMGHWATEGIHRQSRGKQRGEKRGGQGMSINDIWHLYLMYHKMILGLLYWHQ